MFTDEARFGRMNRLRPCWAPTGIRPGVAAQLIREYARKFSRQDILLVLDGAPNHRCGDLSVPDNITLLYLPPYSPELNPKENLWDEIREKIFKNYALKSMHEVYAKLRQAVLYIERNPNLVRSITSFPYIVNSL
jgi:transposase